MLILNKTENILICPLEWGLGHAGRMIALASKLKEMKKNIFFGAGEKHLSFFRKELPGITCIEFPGFKPRYSRCFPQFFILLLQSPLLLYHIVLEHFRLKRIIKENAIDMVISDNRFGLWNRNIRTVYITHMPLIPCPGFFFFLEYPGIFMHRIIIKKYNYCLIPDLPGEINLSGRLSHGIRLPGNVRYIGILSRFSGNKYEDIPFSAGCPENIVILSGPEPQRSVLQNKLKQVFEKKEESTIFLAGNPEKTREKDCSGKITEYQHLTAKEMGKLIKAGKYIITRPGYTSVMELVSLNCTALLIPTPGQTEQEYLAKYLAGKGWFRSLSQKEINPGISIRNSEVPGIFDTINRESRKLLEEVLMDLFDYQHNS